MSPKRRRLPDDFLVREAAEDDGEALVAFTCSKGRACEDEVERFAQEKALDCAASGLHHGYRLLLVQEEKRLVACAGYHREPLLIESFEEPQDAILIHLLAVCLSDQGRKLDDGSALSDAVLQTAIFNAMEELGYDVVTTIVAQDNLRALAIVERNGFRSQIGYGPGYVRLTGRFQK